MRAGHCTDHIETVEAVVQGEGDLVGFKFK